jgi:hypothetical protein
MSDMVVEEEGAGGAARSGAEREGREGPEGGEQESFSSNEIDKKTE